MVKSVSTLTDSGALRGTSFEGGLGRPDADERRLHVARPTESATRTLEGIAREGELAITRSPLLGSLGPHESHHRKVEVGSSSDGVECRRRETPRLDSCGSSRAFGQPKEIAQRRGGFIASKAGEDHPLE